MTYFTSTYDVDSNQDGKNVHFLANLDSDMVFFFPFSFFYVHSKVLAMGFDEKFIRTWDYYFIYSAAGFNSLTLADYQVLLSGLAC